MNQKIGDQARLIEVLSWRPTGDDVPARQKLEVALSTVLSDRVLQHLPPPLQLERQTRDVSSWIDARAQESQVLLVNWKQSEELIGLVFLALDSDATARRTVHIGYLLAEKVWGQGVASELLKGLVAASRSDDTVRLIGGVGKDNPASSWVLRKAGFVFNSDMSTADTDMYICDLE